MSNEQQDITVSSKEFVNQTEAVIQSYRRGTKHFDLSQKTQRPLIEAVNAMTKGNDALEQLGNAPDVMKSHATSATTAKNQIGVCSKNLSECHHKLLSAWGHVTGAREQ